MSESKAGMSKTMQEAERMMRICNACRYCSGFCAVFPAMELRRSFTDKDLTYLANLCHNCRGCYYACQYAPPHEFQLNLPATFEELRRETWQRFSWPEIFGGLFRRNALAVLLITSACVAMVLALTFLLQETAVIFSEHQGEGAFYKVVPLTVMVVPAMLVSLYGALVLGAGFVRFWQLADGSMGSLLDLRAHGRAVLDVLQLRWLRGGGDGCNYPDESFSHGRRRLHHLVFYGFMLCLASTSLAAFQEHFMGLQAPYPYLSWTVVLGTVGGVMQVIGTSGFMLLRLRRDRRPDPEADPGLEAGLNLMLFLTNTTGLALMALRESSAMGLLLVIHLGFVLGLFLTLPYGKFVHAVYRYGALVRNAREQQAEGI